MSKPKSKDRPTLTAKVKPARRQPITITIEPEVLAWIDERADNRSEQINGDLTRYYRLLAEIRPTLREKFSPQELSLILDACNGWMMDFSSPAYIWMEVADAIRLNQLDKKWEIAKPDDLVQRLRTLSWVERVALADAITRWWHAVGEGDHSREAARALE
jgi:hypothetical protein